MFFILNFDVILAVGGLLYAFYLWSTWHYGRFANSNVPYIKPLPLVGNMGRILFRMENLATIFRRHYSLFPDNRFVGLFQMRLPTLMVRDPELIRQVGIKDFDNFPNHRPFADDQVDPLLGNNLFNLQDEKWRDMRATLSPAFTGSKMRNMYSLVSGCAQQMVEYLKGETVKKGSLELEMKDLFSRYANDVIATTAFGLKVDSLENRENLFYMMGKRLSDFTNLKVSLKFFCFQMMPKVMRFLKIQLLDAECTQFFRQIILETMVTRQKEGIVRPDMIHLLMQARQGTLQHDNTNTTLTQQDAGFATVIESDVGKTQVKKRAWSDDELIAQGMIFFFAGFDTTSTVLCFTCYELAINPDVQKRLQEEIDEVGQELGDNRTPDYEGINSMKYLDMVISEGLRIWPPFPSIDRVCFNPYILEDYEGNEFQVRKGETIFIPSFSLHRDPKYYENPDKFDPERFSDENKKNIKPFTYLPFGLGPRNCIGSRFALMEVKAIIFNILRHFDIVPYEKTQIPIVLSKKSMTLTAENGFWLCLKPRKISKRL